MSVRTATIAERPAHLGGGWTLSGPNLGHLDGRTYPTGADALRAVKRQSRRKVAAGAEFDAVAVTWETITSIGKSVARVLAGR